MYGVNYILDYNLCSVIDHNLSWLSLFLLFKWVIWLLRSPIFSEKGMACGQVCFYGFFIKWLWLVVLASRFHSTFRLQLALIFFFFYYDFMVFLIFLSQMLMGTYFKIISVFYSFFYIYIFFWILVIFLELLCNLIH